VTSRAEAFPGIPGLGASNDNFAVEAIGYLDLQPGVYVIGGRSDDSVDFPWGPILVTLRRCGSPTPCLDGSNHL
jgi:hypothetical protein